MKNPSTRESTPKHGPYPSCPVSRLACLREICDVAEERTGWACYIIGNEIWVRERNQDQRVDSDPEVD